MSSDPMNYIITGAPGTGKSTLLGVLEERGYPCWEELSRKVIREEMERGSDQLPWKDLLGFSEKVLQRMLAQKKELPTDRICFLDRGVPDLIAYLEHAGEEVPSRFYQEARSPVYSRTAFIAPPWGSIFVNDAERPESFEKAVSLDRSLHHAYQRLGYELVPLPRETPEERANFLEGHLVRIGVKDR